MRLELPALGRRLDVTYQPGSERYSVCRQDRPLGRGDPPAETHRDGIRGEDLGGWLHETTAPNAPVQPAAAA